MTEGGWIFDVVDRVTAYQAVELAEQEAEERVYEKLTRWNDPTRRHCRNLSSICALIIRFTEWMKPTVSLPEVVRIIVRGVSFRIKKVRYVRHRRYANSSATNAGPYCSTTMCWHPISDWNRSRKSSAWVSRWTSIKGWMPGELVMTLTFSICCHG